MKMKIPGKPHQSAISLKELADLFPDEESAVQWFESIYWPKGRCCGHCGSIETKAVPNSKPMPYWCKTCRSYFSVRTGTSLQNSRLPLRKWVFGIYIYVTDLKNISSMKLHRDLNITQKTAWFMLNRLREAWDTTGIDKFDSTIVVDKVHFGKKHQNISDMKIKKLEGTSPRVVDKTTVLMAKDQASNYIRAKAIEATDKPRMHNFEADKTVAKSKDYTGDAESFKGMPNPHESIRRRNSKNVRVQALYKRRRTDAILDHRIDHAEPHILRPHRKQRAGFGNTAAFTALRLVNLILLNRYPSRHSHSKSTIYPAPHGHKTNIMTNTKIFKKMTRMLVSQFDQN